jgi:ABC-type lipoprotein release transport system permease subunit
MKVRFWLRIAFLFVWRSWRSTMALTLMVLFSVAALIFLAALAVGTNDAMVRNSVGLLFGHIVAENLPSSVTKNDLAVNGVKGVLFRKSRPFVLGHGDGLETVSFVGMEPLQEKTFTVLWKKTIRGRYPRDGEKALFVSADVARRIGAHVGQVVNYGARPGVWDGKMVISGIYRTGIAQLDQGVVFCPLEALSFGSAPISAAIFLEDGVRPETVLRKYRAAGLGGVFRAWTEFMPDLKQLIDLNFVSMAIVMALVFAIVSLSISCTFVIFILKNIREHGIMKAMGVTPLESACLIVSQIFLVTAAASAIGVVCGAVACLLVRRTGIDLTSFTSHNQYFAVSGVIYPRLTLFSLCLPPLMAIAFGLVASVWPALFVIRRKAADILRAL